MFEQFKVYIIVMIAALFTTLSIYTYILSVRLDTANMKLAVVDNDSAIQKEKVKEVIKQAVNSGVSRAVKYAQRIVKTEEDGVIGAKT